MKYQSQIEDSIYEIEIEEDGSGITIDGEAVATNLLQVGPLGLYSLLIDNASVELVVEETQHGYRVMLGGRSFDVRVADERELRLAGGKVVLEAHSGEVAVKAPIPGLVVRVLVAEGDEVAKNQPLVILEAMKMENELRAPRAGVVTAVKAEVGESVNQGAALVVLE